MFAKSEFTGYLRQDGRKGIRNTILVVYLVECAHHVAREIVYPFRKKGVHLIGFSGCYPNQYAFDMMSRLCSHPNTGGVLLVSLGCESFDRRGLAQRVRESGRPVETLVIQERGGTLTTIDRGQMWLEQTLTELEETTTRTTMTVDELVVGAICGGSDATSGITANPAIGRCFDLLVENEASAIFEEGGELIGCEQIMAERAVTPELANEILGTMDKDRALLHDDGARQFCCRQCRWRVDNGRGKVDGGLRQERLITDSGTDQTWRRAAGGRVVPDGHCTGRRSPLWLPKHQRHGRNRRADRLRSASDAVFDGARVCGRVGNFSSDQGVRQPGNLQANGR